MTTPFEILLIQLQTASRGGRGDMSQPFPDHPQGVLSWIGLLLERETMSGWNDQTYRPLVPESLLEHRLSDTEVELIVDCLIRLLHGSHSSIAATSAWALGKTRHGRVGDELLGFLENWRRHDDDLLYQTLIALDNFGSIADCRELDAIALHGPVRSSEFARRVLRRLEKAT